MTTEVRSRATNDHTKARETATQKATQIFGTPVHRSILDDIKFKSYLVDTLRFGIVVRVPRRLIEPT